MVEFLGLGNQCFMQAEQLFLKILKEAQGGHLPGRRDNVVGGLAAVYMVVGVDDGVIPLLAA